MPPGKVHELAFLWFGLPGSHWRPQIQHNCFSSQTFRAPLAYPSTNPRTSRQKIWFPWVSSDIPNFLAPTPTRGNPHPTGRYPYPKLEFVLLFLVRQTLVKFKGALSAGTFWSFRAIGQTCSCKPKNPVASQNAHSKTGQGTEQVKTGQVNPDHLSGHLCGHFRGHLRGTFRGNFLPWWLAWAFLWAHSWGHSWAHLWVKARFFFFCLLCLSPNQKRYAASNELPQQRCR